MKKYLFTGLMLTFLVAACCPRVTPVPSSQEAISREAEQLIRASLSDLLMQKTASLYRGQASSMLVGEGATPADAEAIIDQALQPLIETEHQRLVESLVPVYLRFFTAAEIHQLLSFYQTEVARKSIRVSPQIATESRQYVRLWSEHFGAELMQRIDAAKTGDGGS